MILSLALFNCRLRRIDGRPTGLNSPVYGNSTAG
jgi:hypothetical protein